MGREGLTTLNRYSSFTSACFQVLDIRTKTEMDLFLLIKEVRQFIQNLRHCFFALTQSQGIQRYSLMVLNPKLGYGCIEF